MRRAPWPWLLALGGTFVLPRWSVSEDLWAHAVGAPNGAVELSLDDYRRRCEGISTVCRKS